MEHLISNILCLYYDDEKILVNYLSESGINSYNLGMSLLDMDLFSFCCGELRNNVIHYNGVKLEYLVNLFLKSFVPDPVTEFYRKDKLIHAKIIYSLRHLILSRDLDLVKDSNNYYFIKL